MEVRPSDIVDEPTQEGVQEILRRRHHLSRDVLVPRAEPLWQALEDKAQDRNSMCRQILGTLLVNIGIVDMGA